MDIRIRRAADNRYADNWYTVYIDSITDDYLMLERQALTNWLGIAPPRKHDVIHVYETSSVGFWLTRDTAEECVEIWPDTIGISAYKSCVEYSVALHEQRTLSACVTIRKTKHVFGFVPKQEECWHVKLLKNGKWKKTRMHLQILDCE